MLSHGHDDSNNINLTTFSSSSSSNTSSNHSPFYTTTRTMEEVWKDINLTVTNHHTTTAKGGYRGFILQDFLAKPFSSNDVTPTNVSSSSPPPPPPLLQPQPMLLNLNSGPDQFCHLEGPFDQVLASANSGSGLLGNNNIMRMVPGTGGDRRHKRMIKNRESAARSRARKQAYTNELENEVERLKQENAMLKRQQEQLEVANSSQMTKKRGLQRTTTAPF